MSASELVVKTDATDIADSSYGFHLHPLPALVLQRFILFLSSQEKPAHKYQLLCDLDALVPCNRVVSVVS